MQDMISADRIAKWQTNKSHWRLLKFRGKARSLGKSLGHLSSEPVEEEK